MDVDHELYIHIKGRLMEYPWGASSTFKELHHYAKVHGLRGITFKRFVKIVQNMGVTSVVRRTDDGVKRLLEYNKAADKYITGELVSFGPCPNCNGTGTVKVPITLDHGQV